MDKPKNKIVLPPMSRKEWEAQPKSFKYFHPYKRARRPLVIDTATKREVKP